MICSAYDTFFSTLADSTKLEIINLLSKHSLTVGEIAKKLNLEQSRVSHNLKILLDKRFVNVKLNGRYRIYSLDENTVAPILKLIDKHVEKYYVDYCKCKGVTWRKRE